MQHIDSHVETAPSAAAPVDPLPFERPCFALLTEPNRELTAQANLAIRGVPFYLPMIFRAARLSARRHAKAIASGVPRPPVTVPLFPRVIFVPCDNALMHRVTGAPGMAAKPFMRFGAFYAILAPRDLAIVRAIEQEERARWLRRQQRGDAVWLPEIGAEVSVAVDEVLGGLRGKVSEVDDRGRITILTTLMQRLVPVKLDVHQIEPV